MTVQNHKNIGLRVITFVIKRFLLGCVKTYLTDFGSDDFT